MVPERPEEGEWPAVRIAAGTSEEGIAAADFDGDGDQDVAALTEGGRVIWAENPGRLVPDWPIHPVGETPPTPDRIAAGDLSGDGRPDLVVTTETPLRDAGVFWFQHPGERGAPWPRHQIAIQFTTNSLDLADLDDDGDLDIVTAEHRGTKKLQIWENVGNGSRWIEHVVDRGKENHLGARVADLDGDGDLEIFGIAWDEYQYLHLWRNDSR
ncbi:MAG: hypothetical protein KatS3mg115_1432 [Candidatus Poribacteria bacterium]|nr:MAG: hypothetical protein KatS3mg115_1432 [Candidatus Poribacteria bacterium]